MSGAAVRHQGALAFGQQYVVPGSGADNTFFLFICGFVAQLTGGDPHIWAPTGASQSAVGFGVATFSLPGGAVLTAVTTGASGKAYAWDVIICQPAPGGPCSYDVVGSY